MNMNKTNREKILLASMPFWATLMPPLGISVLKSYLQQYGYDVTTRDLNTESQFKEPQEKYFRTLKGYVPDSSRGNFYNIGNDVIRNHMMAYLHRAPGDEARYTRLVKSIVYQTYFVDIGDEQVREMDRVLGDYYRRLEAYFVDLLERERPTVLGLSVLEDTLPSSLFAFRLCKQKYPGIRTVMGGGIFTSRLALGSPNWRSFLEKTPYIDKILVGEGEILFRKFLTGQLAPGQKVATLADIGGEAVDIDNAPVPDFSDLDMEYYPYQGAYSSRGCPFQCSFCSETVFWGTYRKKNAGQIARELLELYRQYGFQLFLMGDSLLNPVADGLARELLKSDTTLYWDGYLRADKHVCDMENTLLWRRGGFYRARLGIESGSQHVLDLMGKQITVEQVKEALVSLARTGIKTTTYWVIGHPGESEDDFQATLDFIEEMKDYIYEVDCNPFEYYLAGQVNSGRWAGKGKDRLLYPADGASLLAIQTYILDCEPAREEIYRRVSRFTEHCRRLDIPNPYSLHDIFKADERWKRIHKNAVPAVAQFKNTGGCIAECKGVEKEITARKTDMETMNFSF
jgi:hypothetical protein